MPDGEDEPEAPPAALRLTFSYAGDRIRLDSQEVDMTPGSVVFAMTASRRRECRQENSPSP
jgi:hypothetical protein